MTQLVLSLAIAYTVARRQTSARLLSTIISGMGEGIIATDHRGLIRFINPAAQELTGWTRGEAAGRPSRDVLRLVDEKTGEMLEDPIEKVLREVRNDSHVVLLSEC